MQFSFVTRWAALQFVGCSINDWRYSSIATIFFIEKRGSIAIANSRYSIDFTVSQMVEAGSIENVIAAHFPSENKID